jgi:hypothetical protein
MNIITTRYTALEPVKTIAICADIGCRAGWEKNFRSLLSHVWRTHRPGAFLVAGDLSLNSAPEEYETLLSILEPYPSWFAGVPGDHDRPLANFRKYFGATRKVVDMGKWRFILANTSSRMFSRSEEEFIKRNVRKNSLILSHVPPEAEGWTFHSLWPRSSDRFLALVDRHRRSIAAAFFGHIHGYSARVRSGVPLIVTGGVAESRTIGGNRYTGNGPLQMMIFNASTGAITLCASKRPA